MTFTLNGGESETVKAIVFYSYENVSATFTLRDACLLYTSDAADDLLCVDLGGRRIIKKKTTNFYICICYNLKTI